MISDDAMNFPKSTLVVVHLMTMLWATTLSEEISLTCPDTARGRLKVLSNLYNCTPYFFPKEEVVICNGVVFIAVPLQWVTARGTLHVQNVSNEGYFVSDISDYTTDLARVTLEFKVLEKVPKGKAICLGLQHLYVNYKPVYDTNSYSIRYSFDFNPLLAVGILTADGNTSKTNRSCNISLLSDVLKLKILGEFNVWDSSFWNFSSPLLGTQLNWIQRLSMYGLSEQGKGTLWEKLQNTSIQLLNVTNIMEQEAVLLKDMPFLREMIFHQASVDAFHHDSFLGMPEMEVLILQETHLSGIPQMIGRMPKLKILEIVNCSHKSINFTIPTKELSTLKNLQVLNLKMNLIYSISGKLPPFSKLRVLKLDGCELSSIEESDFMGFPVLFELTLSKNRLTHLKENTFRPLKRLKLLDLSFNKLTNWPVLYDFSFILLDMSGNLLSDVYNLGNTRTTVEVLNISYNSILEWDDKYVFSLQISLNSNYDQLNKLSTSHSEVSNKKNLFASGSNETMIMELPTTQRAELSIPLHFGSQRKLSHRNPANLSVNFYDQTKLPKNDKGEKNSVNNFENTIQSGSLMKSNFWVMKINISHNLISGMSATMMQSLEGIHEVDLGGNEFDCVDCRMIPFQKWLNTTSTNIRNLGTSDPLLCSSPVSQKGTPVNLVQYDEEPCLEKIRTTSLLTLLGVPLGAISILVVTAAVVIYKFRSRISYMLHLYKIRQKAMAFSQSVFNRYAFDAFICYSAKDRRFVLTQLAPLLEKGKEQYCVCLHERDFPLGSHIVSNIVGSIQHSRKTIVVLSDHFINSKWCQWELEMANHKMFNEDEHFLILIQLDTLDRNKLPRHVQFLMDTRTYLEWPSPGQNDEKELVVQRLKKALGPSIFQTTNERAPLLDDVMEDY